MFPLLGGTCSLATTSSVPSEALHVREGTKVVINRDRQEEDKIFFLITHCAQTLYASLLAFLTTCITCIEISIAYYVNAQSADTRLRY